MYDFAVNYQLFCRPVTGTLHALGCYEAVSSRIDTFHACPIFSGALGMRGKAVSLAYRATSIEQTNTRT